MKEANDFANQHAEQLKESQRQLQASQQVVTQLTSAFQALSAQPPPLTASAAPKKNLSSRHLTAKMSSSG